MAMAVVMRWRHACESLIVTESATRSHLTNNLIDNAAGRRIYGVRDPRRERRGLGRVRGGRVLRSERRRVDGFDFGSEWQRRTRDQRGRRVRYIHVIQHHAFMFIEYHVPHFFKVSVIYMVIVIAPGSV